MEAEPPNAEEIYEELNTFDNKKGYLSMSKTNHDSLDMDRPLCDSQENRNASLESSLVYSILDNDWIEATGSVAMLEIIRDKYQTVGESAGINAAIADHAMNKIDAFLNLEDAWSLDDHYKLIK